MILSAMRFRICNATCKCAFHDMIATSSIRKYSMSSMPRRYASLPAVLSGQCCEKYALTLHGLRLVHQLEKRNIAIQDAS
eukprot:3613193-Pleurochrysis_carterae.AAC.2